MQELQARYRQGTELQRQGDLPGTARSFEEMLALSPDDPDAHLYLALAYHRMGRGGEAQALLLQALRLKPGSPHALALLGESFRSAGMLLRAIAAWNLVVAGNPLHFDATFFLAEAWTQLGQIEQAVALYRQALRIQPGHCNALIHLLHLLHTLCRWEEAEAVKQQLLAAIRAGGSWMEPSLVLAYLPELHWQNASAYAQAFFPNNFAYDAKRPFQSKTGQRLKLGYLITENVPADFYNLIAQHDCNRFEIFFYIQVVTDQGMAFDGPIRAITFLADRDAAELMRKDGIDLLIITNGYERGNRLAIASLRPAPVQLLYPSYPATLGTDFIDYFITDAIAAPEGADKNFSEKLIRLPQAYIACGGERMLRALEDAYLTVAQRHRDGRPPEAFSLLPA